MLNATRPQTVFEADPQYWQSGAIRSRLGDPADIPRLPFLRASVLNVQMDLGVLERSGNTYMTFRAGGANCDDLRLAYSKIMTEFEVVVDDDFGDLPQVAAILCWDASKTQRSLVWALLLPVDIHPS